MLLRDLLREPGFMVMYDHLTGVSQSNDRSRVAVIFGSGEANKELNPYINWKVVPAMKVVCLDKDQQALEKIQNRFKPFPNITIETIPLDFLKEPENGYENINHYLTNLLLYYNPNAVIAGNLECYFPGPVAKSILAPAINGGYPTFVYSPSPTMDYYLQQYPNYKDTFKLRLGIGVGVPDYSLYYEPCGCFDIKFYPNIKVMPVAQQQIEWPIKLRDGTVAYPRTLSEFLILMDLIEKDHQLSSKIAYICGFTSSEYIPPKPPDLSDEYRLYRHGFRWMVGLNIDDHNKTTVAWWFTIDAFEGRHR